MCLCSKRAFKSASKVVGKTKDVSKNLETSLARLMHSDSQEKIGWQRYCCIFLTI